MIFAIALTQLFQQHTSLPVLSSFQRRPTVFTWADVDGDARPELATVRADGVVRLLKFTGRNRIEDATEAAGLAGVEDAALLLWEDYDADGRLDLFVAARRGRSRLFHNEGQGFFLERTLAGGLSIEGAVFSARWLDHDGDGRMDLHVVTEQASLLLRGLEGGWLEPVENGDADGNRDALNLGRRQNRPPSVAVVSTTLTFGSDTSWDVLDASGNMQGSAQTVCLNGVSPSSCPQGATLYGYAGSAWPADLGPIPGAAWIWAPGITGATAPASLAEFTFVKTFTLAGSPVSGSISIAADDFAEVRVNGQVVGQIGSVTDIAAAFDAQMMLTTFDITSFLTAGSNTIEVLARNGPGIWAGCRRHVRAIGFPLGSDCPYRVNPAGVVFGGVLESSP